MLGHVSLSGIHELAHMHPFFVFVADPVRAPESASGGAQFRHRAGHSFTKELANGAIDLGLAASALNAFYAWFHAHTCRTAHAVLMGPE